MAGRVSHSGVTKRRKDRKLIINEALGSGGIGVRAQTSFTVKVSLFQKIDLLVSWSVACVDIATSLGP